jgi:hypothetical protein
MTVTVQLRVQGVYIQVLTLSYRNGAQPSSHRGGGPIRRERKARRDKINPTDPELVRALVQGSAQRLCPVLEALPVDRGPWVPGYQVRIVDGNHLPASCWRSPETA